jgi:hypothetical protein
MDSTTAQTTVRDYVCAHCWGRLVMNITKDGWEVTCIKGHETGFVTKAFAEARRAESQVEKVEVNELLRRVGVLPERPKKTEEQILKELGY